MATITASTFTTAINDATLEASDAEALIDVAIDLLNMYGAELSNMGGTAGSKTVSVESRQSGAIMLVTRAVYYSFYRGVESATIGGLTTSNPDLLSNPNVLRTVKEAARRLTELEVDVG